MAGLVWIAGTCSPQSDDFAGGCEESIECGQGFVCDEFKQCVPGRGRGDVVIEDIGEEEDVTRGTPDVVELFGTGGCKPCSSDASCDAGMRCHPLSGGTFCFANCDSTDECGTGWWCYKLGNEGKQCIPMAFRCDPECLLNGCPVGQVCNQETGACREPVGECGTCEQDWECADGYRCYENGNYCAPACADGVCPANGACEQVNEIAMHLCVSQSVVCCFGYECSGGTCPAETPFPKDGGCVECIEDAHCGADICGADNTCVSGNCTPDKPYDFNGGCVECLTSAHCDAGEVCVNHVCSHEPPWEDPCQDPYPAWTQINGVWACVQCTDDSYCTGTQICDTTIFACVGEGGDTNTNCNGCTSEEGCVSFIDMFELDCDVPSGCCYDVNGGCEAVEAFCPGSQCVSLLDFLGDGGGISMPEGLGIAVCSCDEPVDMMALETCLPGACPTGGCAAGAVCVEASVLTELLGGSGGTPSESGYCVSLSALLGGLF